MTDYILISVAMILGVGYHVMQKIATLRVKFPTMRPGDVFNTFFVEEWNTLIVSGLVWATGLFVLYVIRTNEVKLPDWVENWGMYAIAAVIAYSGQRLAYKILGTAEQALSDKINGGGPASGN